MRFAWGVVGGLTPEAYRLWLLRSDGWLPPRKAWPGTALMIIMSGLFSQAAAAPRSPLAAIYIGLSTPYLMSCLLAKAQAQFVPNHQSPALPETPTPSQKEPRVDTLSADDTIVKPFGYSIGLFARTLVR